MKLKKIKLENIRSYESEEIVFPEGSTLLSGDIGSGKTSILLAIEYALFGLQPGQKGSALLSNKNDFGSVSLDFQIDNNEIKIERKLKRGSKSISQDYAAITINGEKTESSVTEIKSKIIELLKYPQEFIRKNNLLYRYTVYTPQEQMKQIILEDAESRLDVLRHVFGIDKYKRIKENLQKLTSKLKEDSRILQVKVSSLEDYKNKLSSSKKFVSLLADKLTGKDIELTKAQLKRKEIEKEVEAIYDKIKEKENFQKEIEKTKIMLANKQEQLADQRKLIEEIEEKIRQKVPFNEEELKNIAEGIIQKKEAIEKLNETYITTSSKLNSLETKKQEDLEKKNRIFKIDICPTCLQDVSENHRHNILNETETLLKRLEKEFEELSSRKNKIIEIISKEKNELTEFEKHKSSLELLRAKNLDLKISEEKLLTLHKSRESLTKDLDFLEKHSETLKGSTLELTKFDNLQKLKSDELKNAFQIEKQVEIESAELRKEIELTRNEISELENKIKETEKIKQELTNILEVEHWLSNNFRNLVEFTEQNILITLREEFTKTFNKWFSMLTTDAFQVHLDESFSPVIMQGDFELDYAFLSGGERTAIALAYRLALNQIINSLLSKIKTQDLVILDEPTDGFSDAQLDKVRDILQELNVGQLILVSHEQKIEGFVDNVIRLQKENGVSLKESNNQNI